MIPFDILALRKGSTGGGGFPTFLSHTDTAFPVAATNHVSNLPTTVSGDLLIALVATDGTMANSLVSTPAGWTARNTQWESTPTARGSIFERVADGSESGGTVDFVTAGSEEAAVSIVRVQTGTYNGSPEISIAAGSGATPTAPTLSPSWGAANTLWVAALFSGRPVPTGFPLPDNQATVNGMSSGTTGASLGLCSRLLNTSSLSPGNWTAPVSSPTVAVTIGIRPV